MSISFRNVLFSLLAALGLVIVAAIPSHAAGAPFQIWGSTKISGGLPSNIPGDTHCTINDSRDLGHPAAGCFKEYGDHIYVKDLASDGRSAMVYYTVNGDDAACVNSFGEGTVARCDLWNEIPENKTVCIYQGNIEMGAGPNRFNYYIGPYSRECFTNNN